MPNIVSFCIRTFSTLGYAQRSSKVGVVILLALSLTIVSPLNLSGQINQQQQEQQQREQQERDRQAREQQQREQQERDRQAREEQQRQEQAREQQERDRQAREQQQREQQERDRQAREQQQRQEQQREEQQRQEQARERQRRDELQRQEQDRQRQTSVTPVQSPSVVHSPVNSPGVGTTTGRDDLGNKPCIKEPCTPPQPKPVAPKPVVPEPVTKLCNGHPCPVCAPGQTPGKDNSCVSASQSNTAAVAPKPAVVTQTCPAGQVWNGAQCIPLSSPCLAGQTRVGASCQADCALATAGAQNYVSILRMARQNKDSACRKDPTGDECRSADATYQMRLAEYRNFLVGVPVQCALQDPSSI